FKQIFESGLISELELKGKLTSVKSGDIIMEIGQIVRFMPIILSGTVKIVRLDEEGRELLLYYIQSNESCAMTFTCCMQQQAYEIRAIAEDDVELLLIPIAVMDEWLVKYPSWKSFVMKTIRNRFN